MSSSEDGDKDRLNLLTTLQKLANGRALEAAAVWSSRSRQCVLEASAKPHAAHKLSATCAPWRHRRVR